MLHANVVYRNDDQNEIGLSLEIASSSLAATLRMPDFADYRYLDGYQPWAASGFAMLAVAFAQFGPELSAVKGPFAKLEIRVAPTAFRATAANSLCVITLTQSAAGGRILVDGPVLRMTWPLSETEMLENLADTLRFVFSICDPTIGDEFPTRVPVPIYSGGTCEPFLFISELNYEVQPWFVAMTKIANPHALQRHGQTATAQAYENFCAGRM
jgi:hypothetical protein